MKNLLLTAAFIVTLSASSTPSLAQPSLKFVDGIEFNPDMNDYASILLMPLIGNSTSIKKIATLSSSSLKLATEACKKMQFKYAQLMDTEIEGVSNFTLFKFIDEWWSTKYRFGGTSKKGIDCSGLTGMLLGTVYAVALPRTAREQYAKSVKILRNQLAQGDLVFFNTRGGVSHVGVYLNNNYFVHASVGKGVTISSLNDPYYNSKYIGAGRMMQAGACN